MATFVGDTMTVRDLIQVLTEIEDQDLPILLYGSGPITLVEQVGPDSATPSEPSISIVGIID